MAVTPTGYADAMEDDLFLMPEERNIKFSRFLDIIQNPASASGVFYIQKQNSNLTEEFGELIEDVEGEIPWASEAFGKKPDAVNFWMGDERAVTSSKWWIVDVFSPLKLRACSAQGPVREHLLRGERN